MADMKKVYDGLIIINLYDKTINVKRRSDTMIKTNKSICSFKWKNSVNIKTSTF